MGEGEEPVEDTGEGHEVVGDIGHDESEDNGPCEEGGNGDKDAHKKEVLEGDDDEGVLDPNLMEMEGVLDADTEGSLNVEEESEGSEEEEGDGGVKGVEKKKAS